MRYDPKIYSSEKLKWKLIKKYKGCTVEKTLPGKQIDTTCGPAYCITSKTEHSIELPDEKEAITTVTNDLRILPGVGPKTVSKLNKQGIKNIYDLRENDYKSGHIDCILNEIESCDMEALMTRIERWHGNNHPSCYRLMGFLEPRDLLFFDIETMGLRFQPAFLIGVGRFENGGFTVRQYLARNLSEEKAVVQAFLDELNCCTSLVSFNGQSFDSRFIKDRMGILGLKGDLNIPHLDLLHMSRRIFDLPNHRLSTIEEHVLGVTRENDLASAMVPNYYSLYLKKGNPGPLVPIIEHNRQDVVSMAILLRLIGSKLRDK